ncbi:hypothetical protein GW916_15310 [bacterium]|nr:hypothetical protein [bacterium]
MNFGKRLVATLGLCGILAMSSQATAGVMLGGYSGYGFGVADGLDLELNYGGTLEFRIFRKITLGGYLDFQKINTGSSLLTAKYMIYGGTLNYWVSPSFYLGAHGGVLKASINGVTDVGSDAVFGGQAGVAIPFSKNVLLGAEGRYVRAASNSSLAFAQAFGKLLLKF